MALALFTTPHQALAQTLCWGSNANGETNTPPQLGNTTAIAAGAYHTCAIQAGSLHTLCWSYNDYDVDTQWRC